MVKSSIVNMLLDNLFLSSLAKCLNLGIHPTTLWQNFVVFEDRLVFGCQFLVALLNKFHREGQGSLNSQKLLIAFQDSCFAGVLFPVRYTVPRYVDEPGLMKFRKFLISF